MHKERVLAYGFSVFASAMLIAWSPMTGPSCSHTTTDIRHGRPVSYHNLCPADSPRIWKGIVPVSPTGTSGSCPSMEDTGTTYKTGADSRRS